MGLLTDLLGDGNATSSSDPAKATGARALAHLLTDGVESCAVGCLGDSTGNNSDEFVMVWEDWLAGQFPAYSFLHRAWNDTNQGYDRRTFRAVGTDGARYFDLDGVADHIYTDDSATLSVTGDLAAMVIVRADDWTPASAQALMAKFGAAGQRSWRWQVSSGGVLQLEWSTDGTTLPGFKSATANLATAIAGLTNDTTTVALAFTLDVDNGAAGNDLKFWWATFDPATGVLGAWTQIGSTVTTAGVTSIFDSTARLEVGARSTVELFAGRVYYGEMRSGTDLAASPIVASMDPSAYTAGTTFKGGEGNTWTAFSDPPVGGAPAVTVLNASTSGMALSYSTDTTRFAKQTPMEPVFSFINYSHNDGTTLAYAASYAGLVDQLKTKYPYADVCAVTQNPKKAPETDAKILAHASRNRQIAQVAAVKGVMLADAYRAFLDTGDPESYVDTDGIHPTAAGKTLMADTVKALFTPWL